MLDLLPPARTDSLVELGLLLQADPREDKIDLGVGTYRDEAGGIPIMRSVKAAEALLLRDQTSKGYLGPVGDKEFCFRLQQAILGDLPPDLGQRIARVQAPGGTGALRLAFQVVAQARPDARVWIGVPTWPAHLPLIQASGLAVRTYEHLDSRGEFNVPAFEAALESATPGDVILLHGCCHNPTGVDLPAEVWKSAAATISAKGLLPLIDLAYPGLGDGLAKDVAGAQTILAACENALVALSASKSFGLYRDRTGLLMLLAGSNAVAANVERVAASHARLLWSNPPDHGAAVVRLILASEDLRTDWRVELNAMRERVNHLRARISALPLERIDLSRLSTRRGMFALLPVGADDVRFLREQHAIYIDASGRINVAGLNAANLPRFAAALAELDSQRARA